MALELCEHFSKEKLDKLFLFTVFEQVVQIEGRKFMEELNERQDQQLKKVFNRMPYEKEFILQQFKVLVEWSDLEILN